MYGGTRFFRASFLLVTITFPSAAQSIARAEPSSSPVAPAAPLQPGPTPAMVAGVPTPNLTASQTSANSVAAVNPALIAMQVSCVIQIDPVIDVSISGYSGNRYGEVSYGSAGFSQEAQFAAGIATSTVTLDAAAQAIHLTPDQRRDLVTVNASVMTGRLFRLEVLLRKGDVAFKPDAANALITALCDQISSAFVQSADAQRKAGEARRTAATQSLGDLQKQLEAVRGALRAAREQTSSVTGQYGDGNFATNNVRNQRQNQLSDLERNRARLKTLEPAGASPLIAEWESVVQLRQQRLDELKAGLSSGKSTQSDVTDQQAKLADAQTHLAVAKQQPDNSTDTFNRNSHAQEATNLKNTIADGEARLKQYDDTLAKLQDPKFLAVLDQIPDLQQQEQTLRQQVVDLQLHFGQPARTPTTGPVVTITILGTSAR